jgi:hypothetical protein
MAIDIYKKSAKTDKDFEDYMMTAWVNYESYDNDWKLTYNRGQKQIYCYNKILTLIQEKKISDNDYSYLLPIQNYISKNKIDSEEALYKFFVNYVWYWWMTLFKIK